MLNILWSLVEVINSLIEVGIICFYINGLLKKSNSNKLYYYIAYFSGSLILSVATLLFSNPEKPQPGLLVAITMLITFIIMICLYEGKIYYKGFFVLLFVVFMVASEVLVMILLTLLYVQIPETFMNPGFGRLIGMVMTKLMLFWIIVVINKILKRKVEVVPFRYWISICLIPFISIFILNIVLWVLFLNDFNKFVIITFIMLGVFYMNYAVFDFIESYSKQLKLKVMEELFDREKQNYEVLEITENEVKTLKHDIKNHIAQIEALLLKGEISTATEHIDSLKKITNELGSVVYTGNIAIDSILNTKGIIAHSSNISYVIKATLLSQISVNPVDICVIFGNAIDNAIEACNRIKNNDIEKFVYISIEQKDKYLVINIQNSADSINKLSNNTFKSMKDDKKVHGFGFESIKRSIEKYDGLISTKFEDNIFNLNIILQIL